MTEPDLTIDIVSDVVCPWCYIGKKRLEIALTMLPPEVRPRLAWRPFRLAPTIPQGGTDRRQYMARKFGSTEKQREMHRPIEQSGKGLGIAFDFEAIEMSPNTLDAHRLLRWAGQAAGQMQPRVAGLLFSAYFEEGADIGDPRILSETARTAGMNGEEVAAQLATDQDREAVLQEIESAQRMGVTGVPCFILNRRMAIVGAREPRQIADALLAANRAPDPQA